METKLKVVATYGSIVRFKNYADEWIVDSAYFKDDKIQINKLHDYERKEDCVSYQKNDKPMIDRRVSGITINDISEIEVIDLFEAIKQGLVYYNQYVELSDRVVSFYINRIGDKIRDAMNVTKITGQTVLLQYCTNNDQRFYIPVTKEDWYFDVMVRSILYTKQLIY